MSRPCAFVEVDVLVVATNVFWTKGYDGASVKDLTKAIGISGSSLYADFGDTRDLYLKTIGCG